MIEGPESVQDKTPYRCLQMLGIQYVFLGWALHIYFVITEFLKFSLYMNIFKILRVEINTSQDLPG